MEEIVTTRRQLRLAVSSALDAYVRADAYDGVDLSDEEVFKLVCRYLLLPGESPDDSAPAPTHYAPTGVLGK